MSVSIDTASSVGDTLISETINHLHNRVSVRKYSDKLVSSEIIDAVLSASFRAPTSSNIQAYSVVIVREQETKNKLSVLTGNQKHVANTPVFLAFCADLTGMEGALKRHGHDMEDNNLEIGLVSTIDASLVGMSAYLAAESLGLHGLMIGGVRNDTKAVAEVLGLPRRAYCVFGMCLGWPAETPELKPRMAYENMVHHEKYDVAKSEAQLDAYDKALAEHYRSIGKNTTDASWTDDIDNKFSIPRRTNLRSALKDLGFNFT
ncbi:MAG: NADPH-dependent oxidoreductase [Alphaproteobacteria bacterium]|nr:NADPH-dependent oxidoreductase [Alphaproteobacteria bacterium]